MRIADIKVTIVNVPFVAPIRWSGGANLDWTRLIIEMRTDDGLVGLGETLGGAVTKALIDAEIAGMFRGEDPFNLDRILAKATFVPLYHGKNGLCAIAGLELACWDLMGKATGRPVCQLLGGRLRDEIPFANYLYYRNPDPAGRNGILGQDQMLAYAEATQKRHGFSAIKLKGGLFPPEEEIVMLRALRRSFPNAKLRYDPQAVLSPATATRIAHSIADLDLEYFEDPCWGHDGMARVRARAPMPLATNMCVIDLESLAVGIRLGSVDVVLGDVCEWGGLTAMKKLQAVCEVFQINLNFHSAGELGIATAAYLHIAAAQPALPHALDTHMLHMSGDVVKPGVIAMTERGTMRVPDGPGFGVALDPDLMARGVEAYRRSGEASVYAEDAAAKGRIPVKSMW
jgi:glucarate dehydratase